MLQIHADTARLGGPLLGLMLWLNPFAAVQAEDDYLSILEAEAQDTGTSSIPAVNPDKTSKRTDGFRKVKAGKLIEPGLDFEAFEEALSMRYSGSNSLYLRLSDGKRKGVYRFYQGDNRISSIREEIVRLLISGS